MVVSLYNINIVIKQVFGITCVSFVISHGSFGVASNFLELLVLLVRSLELFLHIEWILAHGIDFGDVAQAFGVSLSNHEFGANFYKFDTILEFESYYVFITGSHDIFREDFNSLNCLSNATHVDYGLVTFLDGGGAVQNFDICLKILDALTLVRILSWGSLR